MEFDTSGVKLLTDYTGPEIEQIKTNLKNLYATKAGTQPMDREFGLNIDFVGDPTLHSGTADLSGDAVY